MDSQRNNNYGDASSPQRSVRSSGGNSAGMSSMSTGATSALLTHISNMSISAPSSPGGRTDKNIQVPDNMEIIVGQGGVKYPTRPPSANDGGRYSLSRASETMSITAAGTTIPAFGGVPPNEKATEEESAVGGKRLFCRGNDVMPATPQRSVMPSSRLTFTLSPLVDFKTDTDFDEMRKKAKEKNEAQVASVSSPAPSQEMAMAAMGSSPVTLTENHSVPNEFAGTHNESFYFSNLADGSNSSWSPPKKDDSGGVAALQAEDDPGQVAALQAEVERLRQELVEKKNHLVMKDEQINEYECTMADLEEEYHIYKLQTSLEKVSIIILYSFFYLLPSNTHTCYEIIPPE